jgi:hypothetical protein
MDAPPRYEDHMADEIALVEGVTSHYGGVTDANAAAISEAGSSRTRDSLDEPPPFVEVDSTESEAESREN